MDSASPEILINKLFAGAYLGEGENIGHEIINLFRADDGENYLYITPSGKVNRAAPTSRVIFVRNLAGKTTVEIIAKAEGISPVDNSAASDITYAGAPLPKILSDNIYHGEAQNLETATLVSFRAASVHAPKAGTRIILTLEKDFTLDDPHAKIIHLDSAAKALAPQGSRKYFSAANDPKAFRALENLLDDAAFWESKNTTEKLTANSAAPSSGPNFLEIIRKENDELIFSNLFQHYFNFHPRMFQIFARDLLGIPDFGSNFNIVRESNANIDLWIEDENHVIVIENKIKSGINGVKSDDYSQLNKYQEFAFAATKNPENSAYGKSAHFYVFTPDYNPLNLEKFHLAQPYKTLYYGALYKFFARHAAEFLADRYFPDFLAALHNHSMSFADLNLSIMRSRFLERVQRIR